MAFDKMAVLRDGTHAKLNFPANEYQVEIEKLAGELSVHLVPTRSAHRQLIAEIVYTSANVQRGTILLETREETKVMTL